MSEDLQNLLDKIQQEGVDKAKSEADRLIAEANQKAREIVAEAKSTAEAYAEDAKTQAESYKASSLRTIQQAAANTVIEVEKSVTAMLEKLLLKDVNLVLGETNLVADLAMEAIRNYLSGNGKIEVAGSQKLLDTLRNKLAAEASQSQGVELVLDEKTGAGFRVLLADGRIEHTFTDTAVSEALAQQLRPSLAALLRK
ncbi:MAG: hypothetical protein IKR48_10110 [Kiritimatiellae bacterium]|nr:hypothetical protein [Kiritimatiellia bacterium]